MKKTYTQNGLIYISVEGTPNHRDCAAKKAYGYVARHYSIADGEKLLKTINRTIKNVHTIAADTSYVCMYSIDISPAIAIGAIAEKSYYVRLSPHYAGKLCNRIRAALAYDKCPTEARRDKLTWYLHIIGDKISRIDRDRIIRDTREYADFADGDWDMPCD